MRVDATQWATYKIVNSVNNYHDRVIGYMIATDKRFQFDDTNHTKLPEGKTDLTLNQSDFSFLTDEQGNKILNLRGISRLDSGSGLYIPLQEVDRNDQDIDVSTFGNQTGTPTKYDKIADNIIRLDFKVAATVTNGLKFYFQRTGSYFVATDTTKEPGVPAILHRGYVISSAYDGALALGRANLQGLGVERELEEQKMITYFKGRNTDTLPRMVPRWESNK